MKRNVYLLEGREATGVSHTGVWIKDLVLEVMDWIGRERFSGATSDSTGSTHLCKKLLVEEVKTVIPNPDICHYISNLIKDVVRIDFFEATIKVVRGTIHFFHTSHMGIHEFKIARSDLNISRGLQAVGKTRFGTIIYSSKSVQRCTPAIQKVIERGKADFSKLADYFGAPNKSSGIHSIKALSFQSNLSQLVSVGTPATKSLACLESNDANAGDVCLFWHATIGEMIKIISDEENHFPNDVCEELLDIIHHRHNNLFVEGGTYYTPLYLAAAYLNPGALPYFLTQSILTLMIILIPISQSSERRLQIRTSRKVFTRCPVPFRSQVCKYVPWRTCC
ncbi:hypothetical protein ARMSODRAFT_894747 [Armillaria solidipes]|uniref:DUF659 domain-containing protein n=1 Tax=Armillaria solidipes TaxID=1076256 RepID=A0A2H3B895_9AGAR|nr:hypothetical protein ARMSODRAFT_894747 [Armillaria solidipes]